MELKNLSDAALEKSLIEIMQKERSVLCAIILHVMEIERRRKYLQSHPNLISYLKDVSKYSHGSAQRRIDAALLTVEVPEILKDVNDGVLNLSQLTLANASFRQASKENKTKVSSETKAALLTEIRGKSVEDSQVILCDRLGIKPKVKTKTKRQADGSVRVEQTFSKEQWQLIERAMQLLSHSVPSNDLTDLVVYMSERVIAHKDKSLTKKAKPTAQPNQMTSNPDLQADVTDIKAAEARVTTIQTEDSKIPSGILIHGRRKHIKIGIQREVFARDRCCQHKDLSTGRVCGSQWQLQLDHIKPAWAGGTDEPENLRVLCGRHNRYRYHVGAGLNSSFAQELSAF